MTPAVLPSGVPPSIIATVERLEKLLVDTTAETGGELVLPLHQQLHAGIYTRTVWQEKGSILVGARVRVPTTIILDGDQCVAGASESPIRFKGRQVLAAEPGRKVVVLAYADSVCTTCFRTDAATVEEAEREYTCEWIMLQNNRLNTSNFLEN